MLTKIKFLMKERGIEGLTPHMCNNNNKCFDKRGGN